jgi:hypothetical protein
MNVDLDVYSRSPLDPLAVALGEDVSVLYVGGEGRSCEAHFSLRDSCKLMLRDSFDRTGADEIMRRFVALIRKLPSGPLPTETELLNS